ncbi:phosphodiester glycosidase family protein [Patescibacteria group bacterium]
MRKLILVAFSVSLILLASGCDELIPTANYPHSDSWYKVDDSLAFLDWEYQRDKETEVIKIFRLSPGDFNISMQYSSANPKYVSEWDESIGGAELIINGAYFHEDYTPSGYLKIDYNRIGERIFDQNLSGLLEIENNILMIRDLSVNPLKSGEKLEFGLQSYPFLVKDSLRGFQEDSGKVARRTAVGTDKEGLIYIIIVDDHRITLYDLMVELIKTDIDFVHVLNLDGGTSTGISVKHGSYKEMHDSLVKVPNVVVFSKR